MRLTWHDGVATLLTAGAVAIYAGFRSGADMPLVSSARWTAVAVLALGLAACAVGGAAAPTPGRTSAGVRVLGWVGGMTLVTGLAAVITGNGVVLAVLVGATVALWLAATARHLVTRHQTRVTAG